LIFGYSSRGYPVKYSGLRNEKRNRHDELLAQTLAAEAHDLSRSVMQIQQIVFSQ